MSSMILTCDKVDINYSGHLLEYHFKNIEQKK